MRYYKQVMGSLERMDIGLNKLYQLVKNGRQKEALKYMEEDLKEIMEDHQSMIKIASTNSTLGAQGTSQTGTL